MTAYYNDHEPFVCAWLRELMKDGLIAEGDIDDRDVWDIKPEELRGYTQVHLFAGIGGWSRALRLAGWPDDRPVWTASCPCQPFSSAGKRRGLADERHLWPAAFHLIDVLRPVVVFGEQVASRDGLAWLDVVLADLDGAGYSTGAVDCPACGVGAPHIRQRLWFVAESEHADRGPEQQAAGAGSGRCGPGGSGELGDSGITGLEERDGRQAGAAPRQHVPVERHGEVGVVGHADESGREARDSERVGDGTRPGKSANPGTCNGFWSDCIWLPCRDGKARPTKPGIQPLAHGVPNRVGTLRGAGNAIVPPLAAEVIRAVMG